MNIKRVLWSDPVLNKLRSFNSKYFTPEETYDYIAQLVMEVEDLLLTGAFKKAYLEEYGKYKNVSRIVIKKFRIYFKLFGDDVVIIAILFPGEK